MFKASSRTFTTTAALGTETTALGAAKATVLESARVKASEEIVSLSLRIVFLYAGLLKRDHAWHKVECR